MNIIKKITVLIFCILLIFSSSTLVLGQNEIGYNEYNPSLKSNKITSFLDSFALKKLDQIIHPLNNTPLNLSDEELEVLNYMSDCKIVGLGEATHGTKEFFQIKHRIFRYLVENHGFKIFAFECDMAESYYVDNFVTNGVGNIGHIMKDIMHFWTWRTEEVKELLLWMQDYNEFRSDEDKIHFLGLDCQHMTYQADLIRNYFNKTNFSLNESNLQFLAEIDQIDFNIYDYYSDITLGKKQEIEQNVDLLLTTFEDLKNELINDSSEFEYKYIKRLVLNIKQTNDVWYGLMHELRFDYRDLYMAQNTLWAVDLFGENTKIALWAHNGHVANILIPKSMGFHLKKELKEQYQILGFAFSQGNFTAMTKENRDYHGLAIHTIEGDSSRLSINHIFHQAKFENFILRVSDIPNISFLNIWAWTPRLFISIGATYGSKFPNNWHYGITFLKLNYDVIINWDVTTAAKQLE